MIIELIRSVRRKPRHVRDTIALGLSGGLTLTIALVWVMALPSNGFDVDELAKEGAQPFASLWDTLRDQSANVPNAFMRPSDTAPSTTSNQLPAELLAALQATSSVPSPTATTTLGDLLRRAATTSSEYVSTSAPRYVQIEAAPRPTTTPATPTTTATTSRQY
jgi:hypothetical protein